VVDVRWPGRDILLCYGLQWLCCQKLLQHEARREYHEIPAVAVSQILGVIKSKPPAREGFGERLMIDLGGEPRILEQKLHIALERPQDGPEPARLMGEVIDVQELSFERRQHFPPLYSKFNHVWKTNLQE
jgi:hypothetical protein